MTNKVKVGLLVDNNTLDYFSNEIVNWLVENRNNYSVFFLSQKIEKNNIKNKIFKTLNNLNKNKSPLLI